MDFLFFFLYFFEVYSIDASVLFPESLVLQSLVIFNLLNRLICKYLSVLPVCCKVRIGSSITVTWEFLLAK